MQGATDRHASGNTRCKFQSTPPVQGATPRVCDIIMSEYISIHAPCAGGDACFGSNHSCNFISIHAPCAGGDVMAIKFSMFMKVFQSTPPVQGATVLKITHLLAKSLISIHAPCAGGDTLKQQGLDHTNISIHAPCAGGDLLQGGHQCTASLAFQSTPPVQGATLIRFVIFGSMEISIHAPCAGGDKLSIILISTS